MIGFFYKNNSIFILKQWQIGYFQKDKIIFEQIKINIIFHEINSEFVDSVINLIEIPLH